MQIQYHKNFRFALSGCSSIFQIIEHKSAIFLSLLDFGGYVFDQDRDKVARVFITHVACQSKALRTFASKSLLPAQVQMRARNKKKHRCNLKLMVRHIRNSIYIANHHKNTHINFKLYGKVRPKDSIIAFLWELCVNILNRLTFFIGRYFYRLNLCAHSLISR